LASWVVGYVLALVLVTIVLIVDFDVVSLGELLEGHESEDGSHEETSLELEAALE
jgi:hypothetical protein